MSSRPVGRVLLFTGLMLVCGALEAQALPDIDRLELENARLIFLDSSGRRQGVLEGAKARKRADGSILIESARLLLRRGGSEYEMRAAEFTYRPDQHEFQAPRGMRVLLPDGGRLVLPPGEGTIDHSDGVRMTFVSQGEATLRTGDRMIQASMAEPVVSVTLHAKGQDDDAGFELHELEVSGRRGARMTVLLGQLPGLEGMREGPAQVTLSCFGDSSLRLTEAGTRGSLYLQRRASMLLERDEPEAVRFELTSGIIEIRGNVRPMQRHATDGKQETLTTLTDVELDASQNVLVTGEGFRGMGTVLRYRELSTRTELRLEGITSFATLMLQRGVDETGVPLGLAMRAEDFIDVLAPTPTGKAALEQIQVELFAKARVQRLRDGVPDWQLAGSQVRLFSWRDSPRSYAHSFDAIAEGFQPLLRVPSPLQPGEGEAFVVSRATLYGAHAEGTLIGNRSEVRVSGPDTLAVVSSDFPLADAIRMGLGLRPAHAALERREGRLLVRSQAILEVELLTGADDGDLRVAAAGDVLLEHRPQPRDDTSLLALRGSFAALELRGGQLRAADLQSDGAEPALATLGYDLLLARELRIREGRGSLRTDARGPGRIIARDAASVRYFTDALAGLPRHRPADESKQPDAGWLDFSGDCFVEIKPESRVLEIHGPDAWLVRGEFELPRAGPSAVRDLAELAGADVQRLFHASGRRAVLQSLGRRDSDQPQVNILTLEGDAYLRSNLDGVLARASDAVEITGVESPDPGRRPFTAALLGRSVLQIDEAADFFGDFVREGVLAYDKRWVLKAEERMEITLRPVDALFPGRGFDAVRKEIEAARDMDHTAGRLAAAERARETLFAMVGELDARETAPAELLQPLRALHEIDRAIALLAEAWQLRVLGDPLSELLEGEATGHLNRAPRLLNELLDIASRGEVVGELYAASGAPPLFLSMRDLLLTFNGLGEVAELQAQGPINVSRADYSLHGASLSRRPDGALVLDGAEIKLPAQTGVEIAGIRSISVADREVRLRGRVPQRTTVTRITGTDMVIRMRFGEPPEE